MSFEVRKLTRRIENRERRLARWIDRADSDADYARIDRLTSRLERSRQKLEKLIGGSSARSVEVAAPAVVEPVAEPVVAAVVKAAEVAEVAEPVVAEPVEVAEKVQDTFTFAVKAQEGYTQIQITAVDSPDSDRFTAGDDLLLKAVASTKFCEDGVGGRSYGSTRVIPTEALEEQVISIGDSLFNEWQNYDQVKLSLVRGKDNEDTLASQTFATAEIYG